MDGVEGARAPSPWRMLHDDGDFRRYWTARVVSLAGDLVTYVVLPVLVYRITGSTFLTSATTGMEAAAYLVVGLLAGALADRWRRGRVMVVTNLLSAVAIGSVPLAGVLGRLSVTHLLLAAAAVQVLFVFFDGADLSALPTLVGRNRIAAANAGVFAASSVTEIVAPPVTGVALAVLAPERLLAVDAASFLASAWLVSRIRRPLHDVERLAARQPVTARLLVADVAEGLRYLWGHPGVRTVTLVGILQSFAMGGFLGMLVPWIDQGLGAGTSGWRFGVLFTAWSVGGLTGAALLPRLVHGRPPVRLVAVTVGASAVLSLAAAVTTVWWLAAGWLVLWGTTASMTSLTIVSYRQQQTPEPLLGRVSTTSRMLAWGIGGTLGALVAGALAVQAGVRVAIVGTGVVGLLAAVVAGTSASARTPVDRPSGPGGAE